MATPFLRVQIETIIFNTLLITSNLLRKDKMSEMYRVIFNLLFLCNIIKKLSLVSFVKCLIKNHHQHQSPLKHFMSRFSLKSSYKNLN